ncbi:MAG: translation initiation factor IF-2 N-terminal domain-containing protein, partial [Geobacteraceae bacterium]
MSKLRVYELAQQMGISNKDLMARLEAMGVEVKTHMAVVDEADAGKLQVPPTVMEVSKEEVRVTTTVIRRRAKIVETVVVPQSVETVTAAAPLTIEEAPVNIEPDKHAVTGGTSETLPVAAKPKPTKTDPSPPERTTATRARILGRMELPSVKTVERRPQERREVQRPAPSSAPGRPPAAGVGRG